MMRTHATEPEPHPWSKRPWTMVTPTEIDIPHTLGRDEAIRRMERGVGKLASHIPGGAAAVTHSWPSAERLALTVATMGVEVPCTVDAEDSRLRVTLHLPSMLSLMSGPIAAIVEKQGERLMLDDKADRTI
ncbi:polyhydroxyalkanoic acid system family protein [Sphingobium xenophagum]|uniref:polyhydroxyalkanoic acid system family protein n=1 Tax=Sphingobium xenophagum TaxID=121428 RepID=UPI00286CEA78|nr:polyhydroxyalkanoic acid system family protein [Sphingobium xenophagum]